MFSVTENLFLGFVPGLQGSSNSEMHDIFFLRHANLEGRSHRPLAGSPIETEKNCVD